MTTETVDTAQPADQSSGTNEATPDLAKLEEDDLLREVYRKVEKETADDDASQKAALTDKGGKEKAEAKPEAGKDTPERGKDGKFVSKNPDMPDDKSEKSDKAPAKKDDSDTSGTKSVTKPESGAKTDAKADPDAKPKYDVGHFRGWSKEHQEAFGKLAPEAQDLVIDRQKASDAAFQRATQELAELRKSADPVLGAIKEHNDYLTELSSGLKTTPADIVKGLIATEQSLRYGTLQEKMSKLLSMAKDYGIPVQPAEHDALADPWQPGSEAYAAFHDLKTRNERLEARLANFERQSQEVESKKTAHSNFQQSIDDMRAAVGEDGEPRYPDFDALRGVMADLFTSGKAETIHQAYAMAVAEKLKEHRKAEEAKQAAQKAKAAGALNVTTAAMPVERFESEEEALRHAYRSAMAS